MAKIVFPEAVLVAVGPKGAITLELGRTEIEIDYTFFWRYRDPSDTPIVVRAYERDGAASLGTFTIDDSAQRAWEQSG